MNIRSELIQHFFYRIEKQKNLGDTAEEDTKEK